MDPVKRNLILIGSAVGAVMLIIVIIVLSVSKAPQTHDKSGYTDPGSGEVIKSDKAPNGEDGAANTTIYPGFSKLIDRGLSPSQVQSIQSMITAYADEKKKHFKEVSLQVDSIRHILPQGTSRTHTLTFNLTVDRSDVYYMTAEYDNTETIHPKLFTADKKTLLYQK